MSKPKAELWGNAFGNVVRHFLAAWFVMLAIGATTSLQWSYWTSLMWVAILAYVVGAGVQGA